jgi:hypothetical protein
MAGGNVSFTQFDGSKKSSWLGVDIQGFVYTWGASVLLSVMLWALAAQIINVDIGLPFSWTYQLIESQFGSTASLWIAVAISMLPAFLLVFVFRRNPGVIGERRKFRYFCRWL